MNTDPYTSSAAADLRAALGDDIPPHADNLSLVIGWISDIDLKAACRDLLRTSEFLTWPAAISFHHAYEGGLLAHTIEVTEIALKIADAVSPLRRDVLIAAALWHDFGKTTEYVKVPLYAAVDSRTRHLPVGDEAWIYDNKARHHILTSAQEFVVAARKHGVDRHVEDAVVHCILAHHGPVKEWGSPEAPRTIEALILHQADMLSAGYGATKEKP